MKKTAAILIAGIMMAAMSTSAFAANSTVKSTAPKTTQAAQIQPVLTSEEPHADLQKKYEKEEYLNVDELETKINSISDSSLKKSLKSLLKAYKKALSAEAKALSKSSSSETTLATLHQAVMNARNQLINALNAGNIAPAPYTTKPASK